MKLQTLDMLREKRRTRSSKRDIDSRKLEQRLTIELKDKLETELLISDRIMIEVNPRVIGEFINILSDSSLSLYEYEQVDKNKFIFSGKEFYI